MSDGMSQQYPDRQRTKPKLRGKTMWSILYEADGDVFQIGPFKNEDEAMQAAADAQISDRGDEVERRVEGEFDIKDQRVYLLGPEHVMVELITEDILGRISK